MLKISFWMRLWMSWVPNILGGTSIPTRLISWSQGVMFTTGLANSKRISLWKSFVLIPWCGPCILVHVLPLDGELDFYYENDFIY